MSKEPTSPVTLKDVAQYAGVSTTTVSRVLNNKGEISEDTRTRVFEAIKSLGYRPSLVAQGLKTKASRLIGLMMPEILSPLFTEIAMGVEAEASQAGYAVVHSNTFYLPEREKSGMYYLLDRYVDGVVFYSPVLPEEELKPLLDQLDACVLINLPTSNPEIGELKVDNLQGMRLAIDHLIQQGCRRIAYFAPSSVSWNGRQREAAFRQAIREAGLPLDPHLNLNFERDASPAEQEAWRDKNLGIPEGAVEMGEWSARRFIEITPNPDAIIAFNDLCAIGVVRGLQQAGKQVPSQMAVLGFDNSFYGSKYIPTITSLGIKSGDIGRLAVRMLIDTLENQVPLSKISLAFEIMSRQSTQRKKIQA